MKQSQLQICKFFILTGIAVITFAISPAEASVPVGPSITIKLNATISSIKTVSRIGLNGSNTVPGSNQWEFLRYSGVNAIRMGTVSNYPYGYNNDKHPYLSTLGWGEGVTDLASFNKNRKAVRDFPETNSLIPWPTFKSFFGGTIDYPDYRLKSAVDLNLDILYNMKRYANSTALNTMAPYSTISSAARWADKWEDWLNRYAFAYYLAKTYGVCNFELYNEPDQWKETYNTDIPEFIERMQIGSDAVQCAIADVNKLLGKNLVANVVGPVVHGELFGLNNTDGDKRDDNAGIGWGEATIDSLHTTYERKGMNTAFSIVNSYCYHIYANSRTESTVAGLVASNRNAILQKNNNQNLPLWVSEWNVNTNDQLDPKITNLNQDSPTKFSSFGAGLGTYNETDLENLFVFQFGVQDILSKNGLYFLATKTTTSTSEVLNVGGLSRSAELLHLFAPAFAKKQKFLPSNVTFTSNGLSANSSTTGVYVTTSKDPITGIRYLWVANTSTNRIPLQIDLTQWNAQTPIKSRFIQEVSENSFGEVYKMKSWNSSIVSNQIIDTIPRYGTWLITLDSTTVKQTDITATDDATVTGGSLSGTKSGSNATLDISMHTTEGQNRNVTFIKFPLSGKISSSETVNRAVLRVAAQKVSHLSTAPAANGDLVVVHAYGLTGSKWNEKNITWDGAPNLMKNSLINGGTDARVNVVKDNFVQGVGTTATFLGQITVSDDHLAPLLPAERALDITNFVATQTDSVTIMLVREVRADLDLLLPNRLDTIWRMRIQSKENSLGYPAPTLSLFTQNKNITALPSSSSSDNDLKIFPNPIKSDLHINYNLDAQSTVAISVFDMTGRRIIQVLKQEQAAGDHNLSTDMSTLSSGIYFLELNIDGSKQKRKFIKQ